MDLHDDNWQPRHIQANQQSSQIYLFNFAEKWSPGGRH
jgi:hypothetical protein